jgi:folylpolyglutamate synthase/dihydropteroate synthase
MVRGFLSKGPPVKLIWVLKELPPSWQRYKTSQSLTGEVDKSKVITVAGTNGKGSCVASMQAILLANDYSVGSFTSPHFHTYNERICINGSPVADHVIVAGI